MYSIHIHKDAPVVTRHRRGSFSRKDSTISHSAAPSRKASREVLHSKKKSTGSKLGYLDAGVGVDAMLVRDLALVENSNKGEGRNFGFNLGDNSNKSKSFDLWGKIFVSRDERLSGQLISEDIRQIRPIRPRMGPGAYACPWFWLRAQ